MNKTTLSVAIVSFNEEARIAQCLESVLAIADEIIVVDSGSSDHTLAIANSFGAKVYAEQWKGFVSQKNSALDKCTCDWVLFLDCDEVLSVQLQQEITEAVQAHACAGYFVQSAPFFMGRQIKYSWGGERKLRLIKRGSGQWAGLDVHETLECAGPVGELAGVFYHYTYLNYERQLEKSTNYSKLGAKSLVAKGRKATIMNLLFNPFWSFFKPYVVKRGFLDGLQGFIIAILAARNTFDKYLMAWEIQHPDTKGTAPEANKH
jgi:glycosyltransferase involved in cell wall biosynthesis